MKQPKSHPGFVGVRLVAVVLLAFSLIALYYTFQIRQGAGYSVVGTLFFPLVVVIGLVGFSLLLFLRTSILPDYDLAEQAAAEEAMTHWGTTGLTALALVVYAFALNLLGYVVATSLFFPSVARVLGSKQPVRDFIIGVVLSVVIYVSFTRFLGVRLPAGILAGIL
jgi:putative tricarboxylic transport membrane protein